MKNSSIAIIGLGYVGLPLGVAFAEKYNVVGFDISNSRVTELNGGIDKTLEVENCKLVSVLSKSKTNNNGLFITSDEKFLRDCNIFIITVPTPIDRHNRPNLSPLIDASVTVSKFLKHGDIVIYESTVYPGVTENEMVPVLERGSRLKFNENFFCGYSPERINPGDKGHTITNILKVTSGSTPLSATFIDNLYKSIITSGTYKAPSIKIAEAAKVIENSQRDINIAFVNELSKIFNLMDIDTTEVLKAAETKWNFLSFKPGLVGGHCIGVDPYYLAQIAQEVGYHPEIILAGRRLNDSMGKYVATEVVKLMMRNDLKVKGSKVLILGFTFKENCPDFRNTKVIDIYLELRSFDIQVEVHDPWARVLDVKHEFGIEINSQISMDVKYSAVILAVAHEEFRKISVRDLVYDSGVVYDVKGFFPANLIDARL